MLSAVIDVGSNSVHLLVARLADGNLQRLRDESEQLGLGDVVDRAGSIPRAKRQEVVASLRRYADAAHADGADRVILLGTEPLRRAGNAAELAAETHQATGLPLNILSEWQEGALTFLGVTEGVLPADPLLVVDIGGGSTEIVQYVPGEPLTVTGLASGSARLAKGVAVGDPPTDSDLDRLRQAAFDLARALPPQPGAVAGRAVFVGGTATKLVRLAPLRPDGLAFAYEVLTSLPAATVAERHRVSLRRASQMAAGAAIVEALFAHFAIDDASVSDASLREGVIRAEAALGAGYLDRLDELTTARYATADASAG
jgi:exopolyphosphatase/guanosine-5'-triphosphate,3'-diphosphate pyrophosphatase